VQRELRKLDLAGDLQRPVIIMHGTFDSTVSPLETAGYKRLVEKTLGREGAERFLAVYYISREWAMVERSSTIWLTSRSMLWKRGSTITRAGEWSVLQRPTISAFIRVSS
jgi:hypothetical protein